MSGGHSRTQLFNPGELPVVLLHLLAARPASGYQLMRQLEMQLGPIYRPSPGSVYPALAALRAEGYIEPVGAHRSASHQVTAAGRAFLAAKSALVADIDARTQATVAQCSPIDTALDRLADRVRSLADQVDPKAVERILARAARSIAALEEQHGRP